MRYSRFSPHEIQNVGQVVSKIYDCFVFSNVMTAFDPSFEKLFYEDFNDDFRFKSGKVIKTSEAIKLNI